MSNATHIPVTHRVGIARRRFTPFAGRSTGYVLGDNFSDYPHTATTTRGIETTAMRVLLDSIGTLAVDDIHFTTWPNGGGSLIVFNTAGGVVYSDVIMSRGDWNPEAVAARFAARVRRNGGRDITPSYYYSPTR